MGSVKTRKFRTEMNQLMDIIIHSLYSNKETFLRELISNSVDAIDKVRFLGLTNPEVLEGNSDWQIRIVPDKKSKTLKVIDNGIGMSAETIVDQLGTIAKSGTAEFLNTIQQAEESARLELIGQFGVGFYACFMVAEKVTVESKMAGDVPGVRWTSTGQDSYTLEDIEKESRGTEITLHMREDALDFLDTWKIETIVKKFSDFVEHPILMDVEEGYGDEKKTVEKTLNSQKAIWLRSKNDISEEEYTEFYKHLSRDFEAPLETIHYMAEGQMEYRALLFLPEKRPPHWMMDDPTKKGPHLYIKRVFITDNAESLLPPYLRFISGVVDSSDLPLNVSRETLQDNPTIRKIRKGLTTKILSTLEEMKKETPEKYETFFKAWGPMLKMGIYTDFANKEKLADLLLYESTRTEPGKFTTLADYVETMPEEQKEIYFIVGESRAGLENSPYLEMFKDKSWEVLLMTDPVDEWVTGHLGVYKEKQLKAADKGEIESEEKDKEKTEEKQKQFGGLLGFFKEQIAQVKEVRLSTRLKDSAAVLVVEEGQMGAHMEAILKGMGQTDIPEAERILEINPTHPTVEAVQKLYDETPDDPRLQDYAKLLYDQAVLAEGSKLSDVSALAARINQLIRKDAASQ